MDKNEKRWVRRGAKATLHVHIGQVCYSVPVKVLVRSRICGVIVNLPCGTELEVSLDMLERPIPPRNV